MTASLDARFRDIYRSYFKSICFFFHRQGFPLWESQELAQDTFLRAYRGLESFRGEATVRTWLFRIARNILKNRFRYHSRLRRNGEEVSLEARQEAGFDTGEASVGSTSEPSPEDVVLSSEQVEMVRRTLEDLPPQMRQCLILRLDQELKYKEIALIMDVSVDTVKSHLFQARQKLKERLGYYFEVDDAKGRS